MRGSGAPNGRDDRAAEPIQGRFSYQIAKTRRRITALPLQPPRTDTVAISVMNPFRPTTTP